MAKTFAENAKKLREQQERLAKGAEPEVERVQSERPSGLGGLVEGTKDLSAKMYAQETIVPAIDSLIDRHKDGQGISKEEVEKTFKGIMEKMVSDNVMTKGEMDDYLKPQKVQTTERVKTGTKMVPEKVEDRGVLNQLGNLMSGKKPKMVEEPIYETRKVISDGPSKFQQDMDKSLQFNDKGKVDAPNLKSLKDKLLNSIGKVCTSLGLDGIAKSCRQSMSLDNQEKLNKVESGMVKMTHEVTKQAKGIGQEVGSKTKGERLGEQTQNIVAKRQKSGDSPSR